jgi:SNF2 family DNA or RNA helicase
MDEMIHVEKHSRGIAVAAPEGADKSPRLVSLVGVLRDQVYVSGGRLIASLDAAADIFASLGTAGVIWDEDLLRIAEHRSNVRDLQLRARLEVAAALEDPRSIVGSYQHIAMLDEHQIQAVAALTVPSLQGIALFDEQGTGKTISTLAAFDLLRSAGRAEKLIVIAPKSVLGSWNEQAKGFLGSQTRVSLAGGSAIQRRRAILRAHDILLVSYDGAIRDELLLRTVIGARPSAYLFVVDESYFVKNPVTARAGAVGRLRQVCARAIVLCGTPAPNAPTDVINQIDIADRGVAFRGKTISKDRGQAAQEVRDGLQKAVVLRRLKADVLPTLAAKEIVKVHLKLTGIQRDLYERARTDLVLEVRSVDDRQFSRDISSFLAKRIRLLQICSNPRGLDPLYDELPAKLGALDHLLDELIDQQGRKVVIWSYFKASLEAIARRFARYGLVRIDGSTGSIDARIAAVESFQGDADIRVFLGNAAAAGAGITLTAAHHAIYESFSNQAAHYMQSVDRIHRRGQTEQVVSHVLIAQNTIEDSEYARLVDKERAGRDLLGDSQAEPLTRDRFLLELEPS